MDEIIVIHFTVDLCYNSCRLYTLVESFSPRILVKNRPNRRDETSKGETRREQCTHSFSSCLGVSTSVYGQHEIGSNSTECLKCVLRTVEVS